MLFLRRGLRALGHAYHFLLTPSRWRRKHWILRVPCPYTAKIRIGKQYRSSLHRSGWGYAMDALHALHRDDGILFDGFIEEYFLWRPRINLLPRTGMRQRGDVPYRVPWIGFLHNPPGAPRWFHYDRTPQMLFEKEIWKQSLPTCRGLFCLSKYLQHWLQERVPVPVVSLTYPTEIPEVRFDLERFLKNNDRTIVQIGWWLRRMHSIYELPTRTYRKIFLHLREPYVRENFLREKEEIGYSGDYASAETVTFLCDPAYDELLSQNLAFMHLYDSSANTAVIECIARATPLLVNPLPAVREYLGDAYPLYFDTLEEAAQKAENVDLIAEAHRYLAQLPKECFSQEYFLRSFAESAIYRSLAP